MVQNWGYKAIGQGLCSIEARYHNPVAAKELHRAAPPSVLTFQMAGVSSGCHPVGVTLQPTPSAVPVAAAAIPAPSWLFLWPGRYKGLPAVGWRPDPLALLAAGAADALHVSCDRRLLPLPLLLLVKVLVLLLLLLV